MNILDSIEWIFFWMNILDFVLNEYFFEWIFWILFWIEFWIESFFGPIQWKNEVSKRIAHLYFQHLANLKVIFLSQGGASDTVDSQGCRSQHWLWLRLLCHPYGLQTEKVGRPFSYTTVLGCPKRIDKQNWFETTLIHSASKDTNESLWLPGSQWRLPWSHNTFAQSCLLNELHWSHF